MMPQPAMSFYEAASEIIKALGGPLTNGNINAVVAWIIKEKGWSGNAWQWNNPLNTTLACCNWIRNVNSAGVKEYPTKQDGIEANVRTITRGYPIITTALRTGNVNQFLSARSELCKWSGHGYTPDCNYPDDVARIYNSLPPPPYIPNGTKPSPFPPPFDWIPYAGAVAIVLGLAIGGAVLIGASFGSSR